MARGTGGSTAQRTPQADDPNLERVLREGPRGALFVTISYAVILIFLWGFMYIGMLTKRG